MKTVNNNIEILAPKKQLRLFGYEDYFNSLRKLFDIGKMPNSILLSGLKGIGKSTFAYHIINYFLSKNEEKKYSVKGHVINKENLSYRLLNTNTHPNFFLIENNILEGDIKIEQVRNLINFLNKSTYSKDLKIVMIDNAENLNLNSSNALLKVLEEPKNNTFFFVIHNSSFKILDTIRSRCTEFKILFTILEKKNIFTNIIKLYKNKFETNEVLENCYFDTPGNLAKYFLILDEESISIKENTLEVIYHFIEKYKIEKNPEILSYLSLFIEKFYFELCLNNNKNLNNHFFNFAKISKQIDDMKKYNLNDKNILISVKDTLQNDKR